MNITMGGEWAYACDPTTRARILCVDAPGEWPVRSMDEDGEVWSHRADGRHKVTRDFNLVPLEKPRKPVEAWAAVDEDAALIFPNRSSAEKWMTAFGGSRLVRLIEAPEDAQ